MIAGVRLLAWHWRRAISEMSETWGAPNPPTGRQGAEVIVHRLNLLWVYYMALLPSGARPTVAEVERAVKAILTETK